MKKKQLIEIVNSALTETLCKGCGEELSPYSYENGGSCYECREKAAKEIILIIKENKNE